MAKKAVRRPPPLTDDQKVERMQTGRKPKREAKSGSDKANYWK